MRWISSWLLELIIKSSCLNNYLKKLFCQASCFNYQSNQDSFFVKHIILTFSVIKTAFLAWHIKFEKRKELKKESNEELMPVEWHPKR